MGDLSSDGADDCMFRVDGGDEYGENDSMDA